MIRNETKIDSVRLFLEWDKVTLNNIDNYTILEVNKGTGELKREKAPHFKNTDRQTSISIQAGVFPGGRKQMKKGVSIAIPSKALGLNYFDGINKDNIRNIHGLLNCKNDFSVSMENLLKARTSDIDFCYDGKLLSDNDFKGFSIELKRLCQDVKIQHYNPSKKGEFYIQTRQTATVNAPFAKIYQKPQEYIGSSHQKSYFNNNDPRIQTTRTEVTLKNQKFIRKYSDIRSSRLLHVLEGNYSNIVSNVFDHYFAPSTKKIAPKMIIDPSKLTPLEMMFYSQMLYELNLNKEITELALTDLIFDRNTLAIDPSERRILRDRRKQIERLYKANFGTNTKANLNNFNKYMKKIGLMN